MSGDDHFIRPDNDIHGSLNLVERLRERARLAREEGTGTALGDALHFEEAANEIERLRAAALEFIRSNDPFGDHFSDHDLKVLTGELIDALESDDICPVCGGDCAGANPPVYNCPRVPIDDAEFGCKP